MAAMDRRRKPAPPRGGRPGARSPLGGARIVHEDAHLLVCDKPPGMVSARLGDATGTTLFHRVKSYVRRGGSRQGAWVIHRLDRDTSGLLVFAKTHAAFLALKDQLKRRQVTRRYVAVVAGEMPSTPRWEWISGFLADGGPGRPVRLLPRPPKDAGPRTRPPARGGLRAVTYYRVAAAGRGHSLLVLRIETGRKHQIRAQLAGIGHAVVGDRLYQPPGKFADPLGRLALHAWQLAFAHPATGEPMCWSAPPPKEFFDLVGAAADVLRGAEAAAPPSTGSAASPEVHPQRGAGEQPAPQQGWDNVAGWYDELVGERCSDYHEQVVLPGVLRLLAPRAGQRILDVACGEGLLCRKLAGCGAACVGVDASSRLVAAAERRAAHLAPAVRPTFVAGDARRLAELPELAAMHGLFDAAACVLALMNIDPFEPVVRGAAEMLRPGGRFVAVVLHPAFRAPGRTSWQWEQRRPPPGGPPAARRDGGRGQPRGRARWKGVATSARQYRRVDAYLSPAHKEIVMNPGQAAGGTPAVTTLTWHRPIQTYVKAFADAALLIDALEEWPSHRASLPGPRAAEEDRARREIPMFLALRGVKPGA